MEALLPPSVPPHEPLVVGGVPSEQCMTLMAEMVAGVGALHEGGIVHRDLKPLNMLLTKDMRVKISDMGLSKTLEQGQGSFHSLGPGSQGWRAPEQIQGGRLTRAVDLFSLGCLLFYCATGGHHPFGADLERDTHILAHRPTLLHLIAHLPEVHHALLRYCKFTIHCSLFTAHYSLLRYCEFTIHCSLFTA
jgi:serine/threonine-protein kinase/endoribonuclease IRE1